MMPGTKPGSAASAATSPYAQTHQRLSATLFTLTTPRDKTQKQLDFTSPRTYKFVDASQCINAAKIIGLQAYVQLVEIITDTLAQVKPQLAKDMMNLALAQKSKKKSKGDELSEGKLLVIFNALAQIQSEEVLEKEATSLELDPKKIDFDEVCRYLSYAAVNLSKLLALIEHVNEPQRTDLTRSLKDAIKTQVTTILNDITTAMSEFREADECVKRYNEYLDSFRSAFAQENDLLTCTQMLMGSPAVKKYQSRADFDRRQQIEALADSLAGSPEPEGAVEIKKLTAKLAAAEEKIRQLETERNKLQADLVTSMQKQLADSQAQQALFQQERERTAEAQSRATASEKELAVLKERQQSITAEIERLRESINEKNAEIERLEAMQADNPLFNSTGLNITGVLSRTGLIATTQNTGLLNRTAVLAHPDYLEVSVDSDNDGDAIPAADHDTIADDTDAELNAIHDLAYSVTEDAGLQIFTLEEKVTDQRALVSTFHQHLHAMYLTLENLWLHIKDPIQNKENSAKLNRAIMQLIKQYPTLLTHDPDLNTYLSAAEKQMSAEELMASAYAQKNESKAIKTSALHLLQLREALTKGNIITDIFSAKSELETIIATYLDRLEHCEALGLKLKIIKMAMESGKLKPSPQQNATIESYHKQYHEVLAEAQKEYAIICRKLAVLCDQINGKIAACNLAIASGLEPLKANFVKQIYATLLERKLDLFDRKGILPRAEKQDDATYRKDLHERVLPKMRENQSYEAHVAACQTLNSKAITGIQKACETLQSTFNDIAPPNLKDNVASLHDKLGHLLNLKAIFASRFYSASKADAAEKDIFTTISATICNDVSANDQDSLLAVLLDAFYQLELSLLQHFGSSCLDPMHSAETLKRVWQQSKEAIEADSFAIAKATNQLLSAELGDMLDAFLQGASLSRLLLNFVSNYAPSASAANDSRVAGFFTMSTGSVKKAKPAKTESKSLFDSDGDDSEDDEDTKAAVATTKTLL